MVGKRLHAYGPREFVGTWNSPNSEGFEHHVSIQMTILQCTLYLMFVSTNIGIHISVIWKALINSATWW